jgi:hypothetical protein
MMQAVGCIKMFVSANSNLHRVLTIRGYKMFGQFRPARLKQRGWKNSAAGLFKILTGIFISQ